MSKKWLSICTLSVVLLGACANDTSEEPVTDDSTSDVLHHDLNQPYDIIGDGERLLNSEYKTDDMRVFLNSETYDLEYASVLRLVVENKGEKPIEVDNAFHLTQGELSLGEQAMLPLGEQVKYETIQVDEGVTEYFNVDLMMWEIVPDELYTIDLTVDGEDVTLEFFTGDLDG